MKHNLIYVCLLFATVLSSCKKNIDVTPQFTLDGSQPLTSLDQAEFVLNGAYQGFRGDGYFNAIPVAGSGVLQPASYSGLPDMMSDDLVETFEDFPNFKRMSEWTYTTDEVNVQITFANVYNVISGVNIILRDIDNIRGDEQRAHLIKAQALAIRAMAHFDLMRYFAPEFLRNSNQFGVPYVKTFDATAKPARNTVKECYDNIYADLNDAISNFNDAGGFNDITKITLNATYAIKARVSLYAGEWQEASDAASFLMDRFPLAEADDFAGIWTDESNEEVIWKVSFQSRTDGAPYENIFFTVGNKSLYRPTIEIDNLYDADDIRHDLYIANIGSFNGIPHDPRLSVIKHRGKNAGAIDEGEGFVDWKVFRVAEMYLIYAEANFYLGNETAAREAIDAIRAVRIISPTLVTESGTALLNVIKTERRKELAFEGHRFFDLKRWDRTPIDRCDEVDTPSNICSLSHDSRSWALPIPETEMGANPSMVQNPGY